MRVAIHQPQYWPWPRYIHKVMSADLFVYLDTVQFNKNGVQNRNQLKSPQGAAWLTLPVRHSFGQKLSETCISDVNAPEKHAHTIAMNYARTPGGRIWKDEIHELLLSQRSGSLAEIAIATTEWMLTKLGVSTRRIRASQLSLPQAERSQMVAGICSCVGAKTYLSGSGAIDYMKQSDFASVQCEVWVQEWTPLRYEQAHKKTDFIDDLSTLDLLLNQPDTARQLIESAGGWKPLWTLV